MGHVFFINHIFKCSGPPPPPILFDQSLKVSQMAFPAFSARHFQQINAKENAIVSCLVYPFLVLSVKYSVNEKIRGKR